MEETTAVTRQDGDAAIMESVLLAGDLSRLNSGQRVVYYQRVCASLGLNPLTKPFDYIQLNGKLLLYAKKDAADQLRRIHNVSIDDVEITETETQFIVKVKGHDGDGRADVEVGVVNKTDMRGDTANAQMKAVTKGKRRLTLSLCGLGWLDETEVETIPGARPVAVEWEAIPVAAREEAPGNPDPIDNKAKAAWEALCARAKAVRVEAPDVDFGKTTKSELRAAYKELEGFVRDAEEQAKGEA